MFKYVYVYERWKREIFFLSLIFPSDDSIRTVLCVHESVETNFTTILQYYPVFLFLFSLVFRSIENNILLIQYSFKNLLFIIQFHLGNFVISLSRSPLTLFYFVYKYK